MKDLEEKIIKAAEAACKRGLGNVQDVFVPEIGWVIRSGEIVEENREAFRKYLDDPKR